MPAKSYLYFGKQHDYVHQYIRRGSSEFKARVELAGTTLNAVDGAADEWIIGKKTIATKGIYYRCRDLDECFPILKTGQGINSWGSEIIP